MTMEDVKLFVGTERSYISQHSEGLDGKFVFATPEVYAMPVVSKQ